MIVEVVDTEEKIMAVLPEIEKFVAHGQITLQNVRMIKKVP
jgi:PII-like signaling protein